MWKCLPLYLFKFNPLPSDSCELTWCHASTDDHLVSGTCTSLVSSLVQLRPFLLDT